ncbi:glucose-1-phosphate thymidylyltransferase [Thermoleophilia bacterium SCSIO 60948]|nr:glucose-1-phosphate thymidylyltransferase [Thermoleophilia bacterium SCSIO 60948]
MSELKGLILSGGAGTRLRPITHTSAKQLVPVANKPVLFYGIEALVDAGITEIAIVIAPQTGEEIREAVGDGSAFGARITWIVQDAPRGLAHAVLCAEEFAGTDPICMYLGDNLLRDGIRELADSFRASSPDASILLTRVPDPEHYGVAELDASGERVVRLVEKPSEPPSDMALVGVYLFGPAIFEAARAIEPSGRGELEITDAIQRLIDSGRRVESHTVSGWWKDTGQLGDMLEANRLVLSDIERETEGAELIDSKLEGPVRIDPGARVERSLIRGPAVIGSGARIIDAYVGPYTSIATDCVVSRAEVEHSILLAGSRIEDVSTRVEASLLGRDARLAQSERRPRTIRTILGDRSEVEVS